MSKTVLIFCIVLFILTGCSNKPFKPLSENLEYVVVVKRTPFGIFKSTVAQGDQMKWLVDQVNSSKQTNAIKSCPAVLEDSFDVIVHYSSKETNDRNFTVFRCPGTTDNYNSGIIEPGISYENLAKVFKQE